MILVVGSPRSGTTWLGKIFDSHPDVIYRHEPDSILVSKEISFHPKKEEADQYLALASRYLAELLQVRDPKVTGSLPIFPKHYRRGTAGLLYSTLIFSAKLAQKHLGFVEGFRRLRIPDLTKESDTRGCTYVVKSVNSLNRTYLFSKARPEMRIIHLLRHPCGYVASRLRGVRLNVMENSTFLRPLSRMDEAKRRNLSLKRMESLTFEEQLACTWMLQNERTMNDMQGDENYRLVVYEELCRGPVQVAKELFEFSGLQWHIQTEQFIRTCENDTQAEHDFFEVLRSPEKAAQRWREELTEEQVARITDLVADSLPGRLFFR
jgi:hypothetical protein